MGLFGLFLMGGEKTHEQNTPKKSQDNPAKIVSTRFFFFMCFPPKSLAAQMKIVVCVSNFSVFHCRRACNAASMGSPRSKNRAPLSFGPSDKKGRARLKKKQEVREVRRCLLACLSLSDTHDQPVSAQAHCEAAKDQQQDELEALKAIYDEATRVPWFYSLHPHCLVSSPLSSLLDLHALPLLGHHPCLLCARHPCPRHPHPLSPPLPPRPPHLAPRLFHTPLPHHPVLILSFVSSSVSSTVFLLFALIHFLLALPFLVLFRGSFHVPSSQSCAFLVLFYTSFSASQA